ncbi:hypothetical protein PCK2_000430 [Pneumocystis canis]|nr:hypothetical protein PCK2_000430 [Pneumocystis canis]
MFYAYKFSSVPLAWRRLYAYANALKAMAEIGMHETEAKIIETLDMALIMTGGADIKPLLMELIDTQKPNIQTNHKTLTTFYIEKSEQIKINFPIRCIQCPSVDIFQNTILALQQPFVIKNSINHWPALSQDGWMKIDTLLNKTHQGLRIVPVEIGRSYTDQAWGQKLMPFHEFLKKYILQMEEPSNAHESEGGNIGYLAQHDLFSQIPALREDITIPDYCFTIPPPIPSHLQKYIKPMPTLHEPLLNAWFGSQGTISPLHTDPYHNILSQVVGWKYVGGGYLTLIRDGPGSAIYFGVYEAMKQYMTPHNSDKLSIGTTAVAGGLAGIAMWSIVFPIDTIKSAIQGSDKANFKSVCTTLYRQGGISRFFPGFGPAILRSFPANSASFLGVEVVHKLLDNLF